MTPRYEGLDIARATASFGVVLLHVYVSVGPLESLGWLIKLRDFALPLMVMSSFFVLTLSLTKKPKKDFREFFEHRFKRLWIPFIVWTIIYCALWMFFIPAILGNETSGDFPVLSVFFTGYMHLWFLQFIFIGSLILYPLIYYYNSELKNSRHLKFSVFCFCVAFLYAVLFHSLLKNYTDWEYSNPELDASLRLFISQVSAYILYVPTGVGIGLAMDKIDKLFNQNFYRIISTVIVVLAAIIHSTTENFPFSREIYGISVFLFAIQPWKRISCGFIYTLSTYSYGVYILHFGFAQILFLLVNLELIRVDEVRTIIFSVIIYVISLITAILIRKLTPWNHFLPLVPVSSSQSCNESTTSFRERNLKKPLLSYKAL